MKVLIVEDNKHKLRTITDFLKQKGLEYDVAKCGVNGIEWLQENKYILIILDMCFRWFEDSELEYYAGMKFLFQAETYCKHTKTPLPDIVIYSELINKIKDDQIKGIIFGKARDEEEFYDVMQEWSEKRLKNLKTKIFIVEDEPNKINTIKKVLKEMNFSNYVIATCLSEAKDVLKKSYDFDIMILDMKFPQSTNSAETYSGIELMRDMEKHYEIIGYPLPKTIVYSIFLFEDACKGDIPKSYCGQTIGEMGLKELLRQFC